MIKAKSLTFTALLSCLFWFSSGAAFTGKVVLDTTWSRVAYLALIPNLEESHTLNKDFIVAAVPISPNGKYVFKTDFLPETEALYRVHFVKKGDPPATLILGGPNENHFFFIAKKNQTLFFEPSAAANTISATQVLGYWPNKQMTMLNQWEQEFESLAEGQSVLKVKLLNEAFDEQMRAIADTAQNMLLGLFAIYQGDFYCKRQEQPEVYFNFLEKWEGSESVYYKDFAANFKPLETQKNNRSLLIGGAVGFLVGLLLVFVLMRLKSSARLSNNSLQTLSVQEKKVYRLLQEGKTNKEISKEYNIGLSTVKTHVSSVLSKMHVKSRKELMK